MRLRVRGSNASMKPVSRKLPASPRRQEIQVTGSAKENATDQPPLWRVNDAIGALAGAVRSLPICAPLPGGSMATSLFFNSSARWRASRACEEVGNLLTNSSNTAATLELLMASQEVVGG